MDPNKNVVAVNGHFDQAQGINNSAINPIKT